MDRWNEVERLFDEVLAKPPEARAAYLDKLAVRDPELCREVVSLLEANEEASDFFDGLSRKFVTPLFSGEEGMPPPDRVGPYHVVREVGRGGMSTVYLAERDDGQFEQQVALKVMRSGEHAGVLHHRFVEERQILASLNHPHVARLLDGGVLPDGRPYFVMEYVDGLPLDRHCDAHRLPIQKRLVLFKVVVETVQYAHRNLVVHRDLKPSNIMVDEEGQVKLLDFGIAKVLDTSQASNTSQTQSGVRWMTPEYAAPEQIKGEHITTATDVYQLGVMLYKLLTGHRPYGIGTTSTYDMERAVCEEEPTRPSTAVSQVEQSERNGATVRITPESVAQTRATELPLLRRTLSGDLDAIVLKALRKEPEARYATAAAFAEDVDRYLAGRPVAARRGTVVYRARKYLRRHPWGAATATAFVLLLISYALTVTVQGQKIAAERDRAKLEADKAEQVTAFLIDLFETSDPNRAQGETITARALLEQGAARMQQELRGQPAVLAEALTAIGQVYEKLGLYDESMALLDTALVLRHQTFTPPHPDIADGLYQLALVHERQGNYEVAEQRLREAGVMWHRLPDSQQEEAKTLRLLGTVRKELDDYAAADSLYNQALVLQRASLGNEHADVAETLTYLADLRADQGELISADSLYHEALRIWDAILKDEHMDVAETLKKTALVKEYQGYFQVADSLYNQALTMYRRLVGEHHPDVAKTLNDLGLLHRDRGDLETAETMLRQALEIKKKLLGDAHPSMAVAYYNLALVLHDRGEYAAAEPFYRLTLAIDRNVYGERHSDVAADLTKLASLLHDEGKLEEADRHYTEALAMMRETLPDSRPMATVLLEFARLKLEQGRMGEAGTMLDEALAIRKVHFSEDHWRLAEVRAAQGAYLKATGRFAEAEPRLLESYRLLEANLGRADRRVQRVIEHLVQLYQAWDRPGEVARYRALLISS